MRGRIKLLAGSMAVAGLLVMGSLGTALAADPTPVPGGGPRGPVAEAANAVCQGLGHGFATLSQALQKLTGLKPEEVLAQRQAGKSAAQIASEKGVSADALATEVLAARKSGLDEAVKAGRITQERADFMLKNMTERVKEGLNRTSGGPMGQGNGPAWAGKEQRGGGPGMGMGQRSGDQSGQRQGPGRMNRAAGQGQTQ